MAKHRGNSASDINTSEDHLLFQEDTAVNEMENDPETEKLYAANEAPIDTANGTVDDGTAGATKTEEVDVTDAVPADIVNGIVDDGIAGATINDGVAANVVTTNVAAADGVKVFTEAAAAEDDQTEDVSALDLEEQREAMQRKADMERDTMLLWAGFHVQAAKVQRILYPAYAVRAVAHAQAELPHNKRSYYLVADYGQNMENPSFNWEQPGCVYY